MSDPIHNRPGKALFYDPTERRIKSFVTRAGRLSSAQAKALEQHGPRFCLPFESDKLDFNAVYDRSAPTILEIGFGMGESTAVIAEAMPEKNFLGVEVHTPGVGGLLKLIAEKQLENLRIVQRDAVEVVTDMIAPGSLAGIHVFFPDPWHKARHNKRRLIQPPFVSLLASRLTPGGYLHCATDWEDYALQMREVLSNEALLSNSMADYAPRPAYRPETKFERRGIRLGHDVWDLVFFRVENK